MTAIVNAEKLAQLDEIELHSGSHGSFESGHCAMEVVAWLADQGHTDAPSCASPVLRRYTIRLNDRWSTEQRQSLKPFLPRMIGSGGDGKDDARVAVATRMLCTDLLGPWLRLAGMDERADALTSLVAATPEDLRRVLYEIRNEAWRKRDESVASLKAKILERLNGKPVAVADAAAAAAAVAAADADAVAVAVAAAVAVADAAAAAAAVAAADADAVAVAVAAAVADAVAVAVAAAVAAAVADAVAVAAADAAAVAAAVAVADAGKSSYWTAYYAARDYFRANPLPVSQKIRDLNAQQAPLALTLLDAMIDPAVSA